MEEDQELKYACKFCTKSFPCGRSLGGHMKSHLTNNSPETEEKLNTGRVKPSSGNNGSSDFGGGSHQQPGYGLRLNPKKTLRLADLSEETSFLLDKFCRECGKGFQSWKALFGHMKCHSEKERVSIESFEEHEGSWTSQSDNETPTAAAPNRRRRSGRRRTRYMGATTSSSNFSIANASVPTTTSSVSETEQEQEEVAMCLMMLSRDSSHWGGLKLVPHNSPEDNSGFSDSPSSVRTTWVADIKDKIDETLKLKNKLTKKVLEPREFESLAVLEGRKSKFCSSDGGFSKNDKLGSNKYNSSKRKIREACDFESRSDRSPKKSSTSRADALDSEVVVCKSSQKRSKFECTTCNKVFRSYQALGGHRASHKKIKGCFASKIEGSENTMETDISPESCCNNENPIEQEIAESSAKSTKGHSCPICYRVFPSGQALGGHKRSHLIGEAKITTQTLVIQKPAAPEARDFLDLNLPAPVEEESSSNHDAAAAAFKPWWVGRSSHKHEAALVGLISN
ncbi:unnamed protein product [Malus baccata var. baccata]